MVGSSAVVSTAAGYAGTPGRMRTIGGTVFRVAIACYAGALLCWLLLGLLPLFADNVSAVHRALASAAQRQSAWGRLAERILHPDTMADVTTGAQTGVEYLYSALNVALGSLLVLRRPDEIVPRLLGFALLGTAATFNLPSHRAFHITGNPWPIASAHFTFHVVSGVAYVWAVVLFPDGRLPRQIRAGPRTTVVAAFVCTATVALICWRSSFLSHPQFFVIFFGVAVPVLGVAAQLLRLREPGTTLAERRTARMLCAALLPAFGAALVWTGARVVSLGSGAHARAAESLAVEVSTWFPVVFAVVPVVLFAAVLRYRLWDLDRWLTRVLVYSLLALLIGAVYVLAVTIGGQLAGPGPLWTLVIALSVVAAAAEPLRARARSWANRVVFGVSLSPEDALRTLTDGLAQLTPAGELQRLMDVTVQATRADTATLWIIDGEVLVPTAAAPAIDRDLQPVDRAAASAQPMDRLKADWCTSVMHQGQERAVLAITGPELRPRDRAIIADIADHAGLVVQNAVLTLGLARRAERRRELSERLRNTRRRLVAAQDAERCRLERNLHDGAQQELVAALIGVRSTDPARPGGSERVSALCETLLMARQSLIELTRADYPSAVADLGLAGAVERAAETTRRLGIEVAVTAHLAADEIALESAVAVYFCCLECLQNVVKYASASAVSIELTSVGDEVHFAVTDDGAGFDPAQVDTVGGLRKLDARLAAVGGVLTVHTRPGGSGTRVSGRVPCRTSVAAQ
jgi:signal transduction histidine kinase